MIAACVILYNPNDNFLGNLITYIKDVDILYVIDNSTLVNSVLVDLIVVQRWYI